MSGVPFLLEIGTEEIPDWMIQPALESLRELFEKLYPVTWTEGTPRRLVLRADSLSAHYKRASLVDRGSDNFLAGSFAHWHRFPGDH